MDGPGGGGRSSFEVSVPQQRGDEQNEGGHESLAQNDLVGEPNVPRGHVLTLACVLEQDSNRALQQLLSVSNTCSGQVLDFSNTSSRPLSPFRLVSAGSKAPQQC